MRAKEGEVTVTKIYFAMRQRIAEECPGTEGDRTKKSLPYRTPGRGWKRESER